MEKSDISNEAYVCGSELQIDAEISHRYSPQNGIFTVLYRYNTYMNWYGSPHKYYHYADHQGEIGMGITGELVTGCYHTNTNPSLNNPRRGLFTIAIFDPNFINFWVRSRYSIRKSTKSFLSLR